MFFFSFSPLTFSREARGRGVPMLLFVTFTSPFLRMDGHGSRLQPTDRGARHSPQPLSPDSESQCHVPSQRSHSFLTWNINQVGWLLPSVSYMLGNETSTKNRSR